MAWGLKMGRGVYSSQRIGCGVGVVAPLWLALQVFTSHAGASTTATGLTQRGTGSGNVNHRPLRVPPRTPKRRAGPFGLISRFFRGRGSPAPSEMAHGPVVANRAPTLANQLSALWPAGAKGREAPSPACHDGGGEAKKKKKGLLSTLVDGGNLRATVMGGSDGLVTSLALVFGVAATAASSSFIVVAGLVGAVGGAASMAVGEWLSVKSQNEKYESKMSKPARKEGVPKKLDSPAGAAFSSGASFLAGAAIPLVPLVVGLNGLGLVLSGSLSAVALLAGGGWLAATSKRSTVVGALRMLVLGGAAAALTYGAGVAVNALFPVESAVGAGAPL